MHSFSVSPLTLLRPRRQVVGMSAVLLPFDEHGGIDWVSFRSHVGRTVAAGLTPAVNMDTGYVNLLDAATRRTVLEQTRSIVGSDSFVAGAYVDDHLGSAFDLDAYRRAAAQIQVHGGTPVIFQSHGLVSLEGDRLLDAYRDIGRDCPRYLAFELSHAFAPFGRIYDLDTYAGLLEIRACIGAKHSSLRREPV